MGRAEANRRSGLILNALFSTGSVRRGAAAILARHPGGSSSDAVTAERSSSGRVSPSGQLQNGSKFMPLLGACHSWLLV
jgi:hypothetical protein